MKCVECGAQTGPSRYCRRCGAPVVDRPLDEALARKTLGTASAKRSTAWATGIYYALFESVRTGASDRLPRCVRNPGQPRPEMASISVSYSIAGNFGLSAGSVD